MDVFVWINLCFSHCASLRMSPRRCALESIGGKYNFKCKCHSLVKQSSVGYSLRWLFSGPFPGLDASEWTCKQSFITTTLLLLSYSITGTACHWYIRPCARWLVISIAFSCPISTSPSYLSVIIGSRKDQFDSFSLFFLGFTRRKNGCLASFINPPFLLLWCPCHSLNFTSSSQPLPLLFYLFCFRLKNL